MRDTENAKKHMKITKITLFQLRTLESLFFSTNIPIDKWRFCSLYGSQKNPLTHMTVAKRNMTNKEFCARFDTAHKNQIWNDLR